jgi:hypothetical protein
MNTMEVKMSETSLVWRDGNRAVSYNGYVYRPALIVVHWEGADLYIEGHCCTSLEAAIAAASRNDWVSIMAESYGG